MPYTMEDFRREIAKENLEKLTVKERLEGLSPEERLEGLSSEEIERLLEQRKKQENSRKRGKKK